MTFIFRSCDIANIEIRHCFYLFDESNAINGSAIFHRRTNLFHRRQKMWLFFISLIQLSFFSNNILFIQFFLFNYLFKIQIPIYLLQLFTHFFAKLMMETFFIINNYFHVLVEKSILKLKFLTHVKDFKS